VFATAFGQRQVAILRGAVQGREAAFLPRVHIGALREQRGDAHAG